MTATQQIPAVHDSLTLERTYNASTTRVFEAWRDVKARERWSKPSDDTDIVYDQAEFKVGGVDIMRCGFKGDLRYSAHVRYLEIIADTRIVMAERIAENGAPQAVSLVTIEMTPEGKSTRLKVTLQISALDGSDMLQGYRDGWGPTLDNLANEF